MITKYLIFFNRQNLLNDITEHLTIEQTLLLSRSFVSQHNLVEWQIQNHVIIHWLLKEFKIKIRIHKAFDLLMQNKDVSLARNI